MSQGLSVAFKLYLRPSEMLVFESEPLLTNCLKRKLAVQAISHCIAGTLNVSLVERYV